MDIRYAQLIDWYRRKYTDLRILDSITPKQIQSKQWLVSELENVIDKNEYDCWLLGGWFGYPLVDYLINSKCGNLISRYMNVDMDKQATSTYWNYLEIFGKVGESSPVSKTVEETVSWNIGSSDKLIINCSSEHMKNIPELWTGKISNSNLFVLQSNNLFNEPDHCNCVNSVDELIDKNELDIILYKGELDLNTYKRFMVIGRYGN